ncbi:L-aspartate oxidase [Nocardioides sp. ChNu-153]|uniref:L-aspartate oxidase n=1 Tax=unclassified Nocardioides TaxID=2615069 RepID=UPI00240591A2|nr:MULTISPECIES: L-aspartate oxidase [unclassified Nocardioides]MDF9716272.1 L-aspartate oxidase [Nocardioides sp. ChNu-99]MDN7121986.1 L-aspartate oxidase [Nocardioides sp. ChNu-153]
MSTPTTRLPQRLSAPEPGWTTRADVVVVGSGIAGLTAALRLRAAGVGRVLVVTKTVLDAGSTQWAQGGIAAALGPGDTPAEHELDTLVAGAGACDGEAVRVLVTEGPEAVRELIGLGAQFDHDPDGELSLTREGGHHRDRIAHAGGDATGAEIQRALIAAVQRDPEVEVVQHALAVDLLLAADGGVAGLTLHVLGEGQRDGVGAVLCRAVVLASGGLGQVFQQTTNPSVTTGDGMALALRAGATLRDLEFVQFHPTVLYLGPDALGQQPLISEAVRGEGAVLVDGPPEEGGRRVMEGVHELGDLAPRDVVAKAITRRMHATGRPHVWLDARALGREFWERRFPTILATCERYGVDPATDLIPVAPACHYASGGVRTDLWGRTGVPGLYATGEVACSGVHGANRLASNSLLEGLVFSRRIATVLPGELRGWSEPADDRRPAGLVSGDVRAELQAVMTERVGVLRSATGLAEAHARLAGLAAVPADRVDVDAWETTNLLTVADALAAAAALRTETRGSHWREDHPDTDDHFPGHFDVTVHEGVRRVALAAAPTRTEETTP